MSRNPADNSLENPSQSVSYHTRMPLMSTDVSYIRTYHQYPQTTGYENQCIKSYQQNMGTHFVSILYNNIISYYLFYYFKALSPQLQRIIIAY